MHHAITTILDAGVFRPLEPAKLPQGTQVEIQIPASAPSRPEVGQPTAWPPGYFEQTAARRKVSFPRGTHGISNGRAAQIPEALVS